MFQVVKVSTQSYHVVNTAIPGGERVEHHSTEEAATQAALRLSCGAPEALEALPLSGASEELGEVLQGRAGEVRARVSVLSSLDTLEALLCLEEAGAGRATVLRAIQDRLSSLEE